MSSWKTSRSAFRMPHPGFCFAQPALGIALLFIAVHAPAAVLYTDLSQDSLTVGERIKYTVSLVIPAGADVRTPPVEHAFGDLAVKDWSLDETEREHSDSLAFTYILTTYTTEPCSIPRLLYIAEHENKQDTVLTDAVPLRPISVIDTDSARLRDLKPQQRVGMPSLWWLWALLAAGAVVAAIIGLRRWLEHRKKPKPPPPPPPPYDEAVEALSALEAKDYLSQGLIREHVFELSDIFKRYMGRRFETNAAEYTTDEMLGWLKRSPLQREDRVLAEDFFRDTDPVKFARMIPQMDTVRRFNTDVRTVLNNTRPRKEQGAKDQGSKVEDHPSFRARDREAVKESVIQGNAQNQETTPPTANTEDRTGGGGSREDKKPGNQAPNASSPNPEP